MAIINISGICDDEMTALLGSVWGMKRPTAMRAVGPSHQKQKLETDILFSFSSFALPACLIPFPLAMSRSVIA